MKRYDHDYMYGISRMHSYMKESDTGEYCLYSDAKKLEAQLDRYRKLAELAATRNDSGDYIDPEYLYKLAKQELGGE